MSGARKRYPSGSSGPLRADVLRVLGVLKVATPDQIQRLTLPHLTYRYTELPESKRKSARNKAHRAAALDLAKHGQTTEAGFSSGGEKLWRLTPLGLEAASRELDRPMDEMGGTARGAGTTGAAHAMAVNKTIAAFIQPKPDLSELAREPEQAVAAVQAVPVGIGSIISWSTEVALPPTGTWSSPGRGGAQADAVLAAPGDDVPLLFLEVDNGWMDPKLIAEKFAKYARFFHRMVKDTDGMERPMWATRWAASGREGLPPVALVFTGRGAKSLNQRMTAVKTLSSQHWGGRWGFERAYVNYDRCIPVLATTLERLQTNGPLGETWWRYGRDTWQSLTEALDNPDGQIIYQARQRAKWEEDRRQGEERRRREEAEWQRQQEEAKADLEAWDREEEEAAREPDRLCQLCQGPLDGDMRLGFGPDPDDAPPEDGLHCPGCRIQLAEPKTRLGRMLRRLG
ncbi:replication-relaxation family protein [Streptomyces sp. NBC_00322]|uniref:replication-relaxation family protein n=1 Tax=Streptomyces sp. NBC_00322 TaxID=2975712 RepID=UPI002E29500E|nr:replication-relaxation family protein [Streptomyces sp. NBC_00322]